MLVFNGVFFFFFYSVDMLPQDTEYKQQHVDNNKLLSVVHCKNVYHTWCYQKTPPRTVISLNVLDVILAGKHAEHRNIGMALW